MKLPFLITNPTNITYLTGFSGTFGYVLLDHKKTYLITDGRYIENAQKLTKNPNRTPNPLFQKMKLEIIDSSEEIIVTLGKLLKALKASSLTFEGEHISVTQFAHLQKKIGVYLKKRSFHETTGVIEQLRQIKTLTELKKLKKAQEITDQIFKMLKKDLKPGLTEKELAWKIEQLIRKYGADEHSFPPIVAFEEHSAIPHHHPTIKKLQKGQIVLIDMGVKYQGYCSDMTRTLFTKTPTIEQEKIYKLVLKAQLEGIKSIKAHTRCKTIDEKARRIIAKAGFGPNFSHSFGHGVGLDIHELPRLSKNSTDVLEKDMVVTAEPGIYLEKKFGVRIEDMLIVKQNHSENLTKSPKELQKTIVKL